MPGLDNYNETMQDKAAREQLAKRRETAVRYLKYAMREEGINGVIFLLQEADVWRALVKRVPISL